MIRFLGCIEHQLTFYEVMSWCMVHFLEHGVLYHKRVQEVSLQFRFIRNLLEMRSVERGISAP